MIVAVVLFKKSCFFSSDGSVRADWNCLKTNLDITEKTKTASFSDQ